MEHLPDLRDPVALTTATSLATARAGLLVAGDAAAAVRVVAREDARLRDVNVETPEGFSQAVRESEAAQPATASRLVKHTSSELATSARSLPSRRPDAS